MSALPPIGARGRRFTLELPLDTPDGFGGLVRSWQPGPQLWGSLRLLAATERVRAGAAEDVGTHRATLAFRDGVTSTMRLTLGPRRFRIKHAADPDGSRRVLDCLVEEIAT